MNYDVSTWIQNMNLAISDTKIILDLAISPKLWLLPSKMIIQKNIIPGYNNMLCMATKDMKFGLNKNINYFHNNRDLQKKIHQNALTSHLDSLSNSIQQQNQKEEKKIITYKDKKSPQHTETSPITAFSISTIIGILVAKFLL